jgi:hypothetical protein
MFQEYIARAAWASSTDVAIRQGLVVSPLESQFGAVGDGIHNDRYAIQAAINYVSDNGGGIVDFGGSENQFAIGGDWDTYGTFHIRGQANPTPFKRGMIYLRPNVILRGNGKSKGGDAPRIFLMPGFQDPGGMFYTRFWESDGQIDNVTFEGIEIDGNIENQIISTYTGGNSDSGLWMHGHGIYGGSLWNLLVHKCKIHGFWGHAVFGFHDVGKVTGRYTLIDNDIYDCMQGGCQVDMNWFYSERNYYHGNGGWTGIGFNVETAALDAEARYITSLNDTFDCRDGLSPLFATVVSFSGYPGLDTNSAEALAAQTHRRRGIMFSGDFYQYSTNLGQRGEIQIINPKCYECNIQVTGWRNIQITNPYIEVNYQPDINRYWPPIGCNISISPGGADEYNDMLTLTGVQIRSDDSQPNIYVRKMRMAKIDANIIGGRSSGIRMESCGSCIVTLFAKNFGTLTAGTPGPSIGPTSSAIVMYGNEGPMDLTIHAQDTRGASAQMQYAAYLNVGYSTSAPVLIRGTSTGHLIAPVNDVNNSVIQDGMYDATVRKRIFNTPVVMNAGLETHGTVDFISDSGSANINLRSPDGTNRNINFMTASGLQFQIAQLQDGGVLFQQFTDGAYQRQPLRFDENGVIAFNATWDNPMQTTNGWLWVDATNILRINLAKPTSDTDGTVVGTQT